MLFKGTEQDQLMKSNNFSSLEQEEIATFLQGASPSRELAEGTSWAGEEADSSARMLRKGAEQNSAVAALQERSRIPISCRETIPHRTPASGSLAS